MKLARSLNRQTTVEAAKAYFGIGLDPLPMGVRSKQPLGVNHNFPDELRKQMELDASFRWRWKRRRIESVTDIERYFHPQLGVAIALGKRSGGLCDVDLDWSEAVPFADLLFADSPAFGRTSAPRTHRVMRCADAGGRRAFQLTPSEADVLGSTDRATIIELRGNGSITLFPPSVHPTDERVEWMTGSELVPELDWENAERLCATIAFLAVVLRAYPRQPGCRHDVGLALTGALLSAGIDEPLVDQLVVCVAQSAGDEEAQSRGGKAASTKERMNQNQPCVGLPRLCELLGIETIEDRLRGWITPSAPAPRTIVVAGGRQHRVYDEAMDALLESGVEIYQRGAELVRPVRLGADGIEGDEDSLVAITNGVRRSRRAVVLLPVSPYWLVLKLGAVAAWERPDRNGRIMRIDPQIKHANLILHGAGDWRFPVLDSVIHAPTLRRDGSVLQDPGFDQSSNLLFDPRGYRFPRVPDAPSRDEAVAALATFEPIFRGFPFVDDAAKAVVFANILTMLVRPLLSAAPLFVYDAPTMGTGKSLLVETVSIIATGAKPAAISIGKTIEETEKRIGTLLRAGDAAIFIDNVEKTVQGDFLCTVLTQERVQIRILGKSERVEMRCAATLKLTGNNVQLSGDLTRRAVWCRIDANQERPDKRQFEFDPRVLAHERFPELAVAGLTALRAFLAAGRPHRLQTVGSFEDWNLIRETLVWLGYADPADTRMTVFDTDPEREAHAELLRCWYDCFGNRPVTLVEVGDACKDAAELTSAPARLFGLFTELTNERGWNARKFGKLLFRLRNTYLGGLALRALGETSSGRRWMVSDARTPLPPPGT